MDEVLDDEELANYKSKLLEYTQSRGMGIPSYDVFRRPGPSIRKASWWACTCRTRNGAAAPVTPRKARNRPGPGGPDQHECGQGKRQGRGTGQGKEQGKGQEKDRDKDAKPAKGEGQGGTRASRESPGDDSHGQH